MLQHRYRFRHPIGEVRRGGSSAEGPAASRTSRRGVAPGAHHHRGMISARRQRTVPDPRLPADPGWARVTSGGWCCSWRPRPFWRRGPAAPDDPAQVAVLLRRAEHRRREAAELRGQLAARGAAPAAAGRQAALTRPRGSPARRPRGGAESRWWAPSCWPGSSSADRAPADAWRRDRPARPRRPAAPTARAGGDGRVPRSEDLARRLAGVPAADWLRSARARQGRAQQGDRGGGVAHRDRRPGREERVPLLRRRLRAERVREGREDRPDRGQPRFAGQPRPALPQGQREQVAGHQPHARDEDPVPPSARDGVGGPRARHGDGDDRRPRAGGPPQGLAGRRTRKAGRCAGAWG